MSFATRRVRKWACAATLLVCGTLATACGSTQAAVRADERATVRDARAQGRAFADFIEGERLASARDWSGAADAFERVIALDPDAWPAYLRVVDAMTARADGEPLEPAVVRRATHLLQRADELNAPAAESGLARARLLEATGAPLEALAALHSVPRDAATGPVHRACYDTAARAELIDEMVRCTTRYTEVYPRSHSAWRYHGFALRRAERLLEAADAFAYSTTLPGADPRNAVSQVETLLEAEQRDAALGAALGCQRRFRDHIECFALEARVRASGRDAGAPLDAPTLAALDRLAARAAANEAALRTAAQTLGSTSDRALVFAFAREIARQRPYNAGLLTRAAWICVAFGGDDVAVELMQRVLELDDANFDALNFIGYTWADAGVELEQAEAMIRRALFLRPESGAIMDSLAWVLYRTDRFEEALVIQLEAVALSPDSAVLWDHLGDIYMALERFTDAVDAYEKALEFGTVYDEDVLETVPLKLRNAQRAAETLGDV